MPCKGICHRYKAKRAGNLSRYASGQKRCNTCEIFLNWDGHWCPCCGKLLRSKPRDGELKRKTLAKTFQNYSQIKIN